MPLFNFFQIRIPQHYDWVVFCVLGGIVAYSFMLISLNREASLKDFVLQSRTESSNGPLNWLITSVVFCVLLSAFISQYLPVVPKRVKDLQVLGFGLNKFGFTFIAISGFYLAKLILSYFLFQSVDSAKKWFRFYFAATKFYFVFSIILMLMCIGFYIFPINRLAVIQYVVPFFAFALVFKVFYYLLNKNNVLPNQWYYKILYICTLQIVPVLVLWKVLFF